MMHAMGANLHDNSPLRLSELIDLEAQLQADRQRSRAALRARDERIARQINAPSLEDRVLLRRWLKATDDDDAARPGKAAKRIVNGAAFLAILGGFGIGFGVVLGWLSIESGKPINAIHLWGALVGLQLILMVITVLAMLPLPGGGLSRILETPARFAAHALTSITTLFSPELRKTARALLGRGKELDQLYARVRFWLIMDLAQIFALFVNAGLLAAFILIPALSDPAFGWRSTLLKSEQVHQATRIIAGPWADIVPGATLSIEDVEQTRYSSLDETFAPSMEGQASNDRWAKWWPFLLCSLIVYCAAPRLILAGVATFRRRSTIHAVRLDRPELAELRDRLQRPQVSTTAETGSGMDHDSFASNTNDTQWPGATLSSLKADVWIAMKWAGVGIDDHALRSELGNRFNGQVQAIHNVGELDIGADAAAIDTVAASAEDVGAALVVPAWEPPNDGFIDFIKAIRAARKDSAPFAVLLFHQDANGQPTPPRPRDAALWHARLAQLGDTHLAAAPLTEGGEA